MWGWRGVCCHSDPSIHLSVCISWIAEYYVSCYWSLWGPVLIDNIRDRRKEDTANLINAEDAQLHYSMNSCSDHKFKYKREWRKKVGLGNWLATLWVLSCKVQDGQKESTYVQVIGDNCKILHITNEGIHSVQSLRIVIYKVLHFLLSSLAYFFSRGEKRGEERHSRMITRRSDWQTRPRPCPIVPPQLTIRWWQHVCIRKTLSRLPERGPNHHTTNTCSLLMEDNPRNLRRTPLKAHVHICALAARLYSSSHNPARPFELPHQRQSSREAVWIYFFICCICWPAVTRLNRANFTPQRKLLHLKESKGHIMFIVLISTLPCSQCNCLMNVYDQLCPPWNLKVNQCKHYIVSGRSCLKHYQKKVSFSAGVPLRWPPGPVHGAWHWPAFRQTEPLSVLPHVAQSG